MLTTTTAQTASTRTTLVGEDSVHLFPNGGWDTHHHIFEPSEFSYCPNRHLTPPAATIASFIAFKNKFGITNSTLTHGLSYGNDCSSLTAFIPRLGSSSTKAVGVFDPEITPDHELLSMHAAGVRGARVNLYAYNAHHDVELQKLALHAHMSRITCLNLPWNLTMTPIDPSFWTTLQSFIETTLSSQGITLITDHFALLKAPSMLPPQYQAFPELQPGYQAILSLVRAGHVYIKLSAPYRVSEQAPHYHDLKFLVRALVDANPDRILWGSDWPHTPRMKVRSREEALKESPYLVVDDKAWLKSLRSWLSDDEWDRIMIRNPERLFG